MNLQEMLTQPPAGGLAGRGTSKGAGVAESDGKFAAAFDSEQAPTNNSAIQDEATPQSSPDDGGEAPPDKGANAEQRDVDTPNQASSDDGQATADGKPTPDESEQKLAQTPTRNVLAPLDGQEVPPSDRPVSPKAGPQDPEAKQLQPGSGAGTIQTATAQTSEGPIDQPRTNQEATATAAQVSKTASNPTDEEGVARQEVRVAKVTGPTASQSKVTAPDGVDVGRPRGESAQYTARGEELSVTVRARPAAAAPEQTAVTTAGAATTGAKQAAPAEQTRGRSAETRLDAPKDMGPTEKSARTAEPKGPTPQAAAPASVGVETPANRTERGARAAMTAEALYQQTAATLSPSTAKPQVAATPATVALPAELQTPAMVERQIAPQLITAAGTRANGGVVEVFLDPPELGRIEISLEVSEQGVRAVLAAERSATADLLRRHMELLNQQFAEAGFDQVELDFGSFSDEAEREAASGDIIPGESRVETTGPDTVVARRPEAPLIGTTTVDIRL